MNAWPEVTLSWPALRGAVLYRDDFECQVCGDPATEVDHIFPRSLGGPDEFENLQAICGPCNKAKGANWLHPDLELDDLERFRGYVLAEHKRITDQMLVYREVITLHQTHRLPIPDCWAALGWRHEDGRIRRPALLPCVEVRAILPRPVHIRRAA